MEKNSFENIIKPNPFDNLSESDLIFLLEHNKEQLTEDQILDIQSRIEKFKKIRESQMEFTKETVQKTYKKTLSSPKRSGRAGYVDIIVLMLTVWVACLCGMAYIYSQLNIMS